MTIDDILDAFEFKKNLNIDDSYISYGNKFIARRYDLFRKTYYFQITEDLNKTSISGWYLLNKLVEHIQSHERSIQRMSEVCDVVEDLGL